MLLHFVPRVTPLIEAPFVVVEQVVKAIFSERRKTIRNSLRYGYGNIEHNYYTHFVIHLTVYDM